MIGTGLLTACTTRTPASGTTADSVPSGAAQVLRPVTALTPAELAVAAPVVAGRLATNGVPDATVTAEGDHLAIHGSVDPYRLQAAARRGPTTLVQVGSVAPGPCTGTGAPSTPPGRRCYQLGAQVATTEAVAGADAEVGDGSGWAVRLRIVAERYQAWRAALSALPTSAAVAAFTVDEADARHLAAALVVHDDAGAAFVAPDPPDPAGPIVHTDFWLAALDVNVCGTWLPPAPAVANDTGLHSHGDGFVYVHPFEPQEAQEHATLGLFLQRGKWSVSDEELKVWDGAVHLRLDPCPDGRGAQMTFWVDGVRQASDPMAWRVRSNQLLTLSFNPDDVDPGTGPAGGHLPLPRLQAVAG
jgi:hypothetical protein